MHYFIQSKLNCVVMHGTHSRAGVGWEGMQSSVYVKEKSVGTVYCTKGPHSFCHVCFDRLHAGFLAPKRIQAGEELFDKTPEKLEGGCRPDIYIATMTMHAASLDYDTPCIQQLQVRHAWIRSETATDISCNWKLFDTLFGILCKNFPDALKTTPVYRRAYSADPLPHCSVPFVGLRCEPDRVFKTESKSHEGFAGQHYHVTRLNP